MAYGFLREVPYRKIESTAKEPQGYWELKRHESLKKEVKRLATKFSFDGKADYSLEIDEWFKKTLDE